MKAFSSPSLVCALALGLALTSCGGPPVEEEESKPTPPAAIVETMPTPPPINKEELLGNYAGLVKADLAFVKSEAEKAGILPLIGQKITGDDLARFATFFWAVDGNLRIAELRCRVHYNRLLEVLKAGETGPSPASADPDQDNASFLISQTIDDSALVQRLVLEGLHALGVKNVKSISPSQELPMAPTMMQELLKLARPPATESTPASMPAPLTQGLKRWMLSEAAAQTTRGKVGAKLPATSPTLLQKPAFPPLVRLKTVTAPLLLARTLTYDVDGKLFVLRSSLSKAAPEFQALAAEQFVYPVEKQLVGSAYRNALESRLNALAALETRSVAQWWEAANLLTELKWAYPLVDLTKEAAESQPATQPPLPGTQPASQPSLPPPASQPAALMPASPAGPGAASLPPPPAGAGTATLPPPAASQPAPSPAGVP